MDDGLDELVIDIRASTQGFAQDIAAMRGTFDSTLVDGFRDAGNVLERGLMSAIKRGSLGFDDLKRVAFQALGEIAEQMARSLSGAGSAGAGAAGGGLLGGLGTLVTGAFGSLLGLPGRATGGPVSPGRGYLVGERGPEMFVPTSSGRVETMDGGNLAGGGRDVRVAINLNAPRGTSAPAAMQRSSRQMASAVRRAFND
ncbi:hypothetical protein HME9302_02227 [Alteripontixanthobacter maritimus]|uniref:Tail tape measure protein n=1 Tax=Alteripontixanthobacter maritimus TaxID=2161824 RepID=A0A369Q9H9_9SPHN|nr:tail tape measure protein [Alteripontixanthobacter maritimus]RDC61010.1 hypothetical protein HME9302_02227 [Alteripontixanthobacter maritimus]